MARDRINLNVLHPAAGGGDLGAVHPVGASHLKEYLSFFFPSDLPVDQEAQQLSHDVLDAMEAWSTDEAVTNLQYSQPLLWLPKWLAKAMPVIRSTRAVGTYLDRCLIGWEDMKADELKERSPITNDFMYGFGVYDLASLAIALEAGLDHPRFREEELARRSDSLHPDSPPTAVVVRSNRERLDVLADAPEVRPIEKAQLAGLRRRGGEIIANTGDLLGRVAAVAQASAAD